MNKSFKQITLYFCILIIGIMIGYTWKMYQTHFTGNSTSETPVLTVSEFIASQPDIAIDLTKNMPVITDYVNRYNK